MKLLRRDIGLILLGVLLLTPILVVNPVRAQTAALYFSPSSGTKLVGETFAVNLRVNTGGAAINAIEGSVLFDPAKVQVTSISRSGSIISIWADEPDFSNAEGTIVFAGGLPSPGYSGANGLILTINLRAKTATNLRNATEINVISGAVLANDGEGTNILASLGKAIFVINATTQAPVADEEVPATSTATTITIKSNTHPDSGQWYSNNNPAFQWSVPGTVEEVILVLSRRANSPPTIRYAPPIAEKLLTDLEDGVWYLNGRFRTAEGLGPVTSFGFNIDTTRPNDFQITRLDSGDPTNPQPQILFASSDELSGISGYEFKIGDGDWVKLDQSVGGKPYSLPLQIPGTRIITVKAVDGAGNSTTATLDIVVAPIPAPEIKEAPTQATGQVKFDVRGIAIAGDKILLYALPEDATDENVAIKIGEGPVNNGQWTIRADGLKSGNYQVFAYAQDSRGARSNRSNMVSLLIKGGFWSYVIEFIKTLFGINGWLTLFIILYVILITILIHYISGRLVPFGKDKKREETGEYKRLIEQLLRLRTDVERELDLLKDIATHRGLYPEEKHLKAKFGKYHTLLKSVLPKVNKKKLGR